MQLRAWCEAKLSNKAKYASRFRGTMGTYSTAFFCFDNFCFDALICLRRLRNIESRFFEATVAALNSVAESADDVSALPLAAAEEKQRSEGNEVKVLND
jgi:hypothetical protein